MTVAASWYLRFLYFGPFLLVCIGVCVDASTPGPIVVACVVTSLAGIRAARIGIAVNDEGLVVRNFWMSYRVRSTDIVESATVTNRGFLGMIRVPYSVVALRLKTDAVVNVVASARGALLGHRTGIAVERALGPLLEDGLRPSAGNPDGSKHGCA